MRNTLFAALLVFAALGTQNVHATSWTSLETTPDILCCRPAPTTIYLATISGEIKDDEAAAKVEMLIKALSGVIRVRIDRETGEALITMDRFSTLTKEDIEKALKGSDFGITELAVASED